MGLGGRNRDAHLTSRFRVCLTEGQVRNRRLNQALGIFGGETAPNARQQLPDDALGVSPS